MWRSIVVPLDGSLSAERAIPVAARLARRAGARLTLLHALDYLRTDFPNCEESVEWWSENTFDRAKRYLAQLSDAVSVRYAVRPDTLVLEMDAVSALTLHEPAITSDLIVMTTEGRNAIDRFRLGSTSHRVLAEARSALLLIPPGGGVRTERTDKPFERILVPLNGSADAERAMPLATEVAQIDGGTVLLLQVRAPQFIPALVGARTASTAHYLDDFAVQLREQGVPVNWHIARASTPVSNEIFSYALEHDIDLIALTRRAGADLRRMFLRGTADTLFQTATIPLLFAAANPENGEARF